MSELSFENYDEILSPQRCARCGAAFSPSPDTFAFCPACNACHVGVAMVPGLVGGHLAKAWMRSFTGTDPINRYTHVMHTTDGRLFVMHSAEQVEAPGGYSALMERGEADSVQGPRYVIVRLAGFPASGARTGHASCSIGPVALRPWGLELIAVGPARAQLAGVPTESVLAELVTLAQQTGYEPVYESTDAEVAALPPEVGAALGARAERAVRCGTCGAPVSARDLGTDPHCPYCLSAVAVPPELARELEGYRRQLQAQDAQFSLRGADVWTRLRDDGPGRWLACAVCGAPRDHQAGMVDEACGHCGAMIVPSAQRLVADVSRARGELEALKARRANAAREQIDRSMKTARGMALVNLALIVVSTAGSAVVALPPIVMIGIQEGKWLQTLLMLVTFGWWPVAIFGYAAWAFRRSSRQAREWGAVWTAIADQLDGRRGANGKAWRDRFGMTAEAKYAFMGPSKAKGAVEATPAGVPVLIEGDVEGRSSPLRQMYGGIAELRLYVAVEWPDEAGVLKTTRGVRQRRRELAAAGFGSCLRRRGLELKASDEVMRRLKAHPEQAVALVPVLFEALRIVNLLGGRPVQA